MTFELYAKVAVGRGTVCTVAKCVWFSLKASGLHCQTDKKEIDGNNSVKSEILE
jgi:hypothetical protein